MPGVEDMPPPKVLDIGANCGMFALHCIFKFGPEVRIIAFEPHPRNFELLKHNLDGFPVECHKLAVVPNEETPGTLYEGKYNLLTCSLIDEGNQNTSKAIEVTGILASELP